MTFDKPKRILADKKTLLHLSLKLAKKGFSPKASLFGIPEWVTLVDMSLYILSKTARQKAIPKSKVRKIQQQYNLNALRKKAKQFHFNPRGMSKAKLLRELSSRGNMCGGSR